jgi:hypothetical protein
MRAPKNIAKVNYTIGEKYLDSNYNPYVGYYCEVKGKAYPGKVYTGLAKPLILASSLVKDNNIKGYVFTSTKDDYQKDSILRYFIKYIHTVPIYLKEIDVTTYNKVKNNPLYQTTALTFTIYSQGHVAGGYFDIDEVEQADKKMSGIKLYLQDELL